jgi:hypothetical protein
MTSVISHCGSYQASTATNEMNRNFNRNERRDLRHLAQTSGLVEKPATEPDLPKAVFTAAII